MSEYIDEQEQLEKRNAIDTDRGSWFIPFAAGIGAIGLGAYLLKSRLAQGGELISNLFNFLGVPKGITLASDAAANVGKAAATSRTAGLRSILNSRFNIAKNQLQIGPIDLIDDLRNSIDLIGIVEPEMAQHIARETTEFINRDLVRYGNNTGYFTQGLQRVTVGQILQDQTAWGKVLGMDQMSVLQKARKMNLVADQTILDRRVFTRGDEVLDLRLRNLFSKVVEVDSPAGPVYQRVGRFDMFGQSNVIAAAFGATRRVALLGPDSAFSGSRIFIDGNVYGYTRTSTGFVPQLLATNRMIRRAGDPFEVLAAAAQGRLETKLPNRTGLFGGIVGWMERNLGVGPAYSTRPSFFQRWIIDPYRRARALNSGEGVVFMHPYRRDFELNKVFDAAVGGDFPELARSGGTLIGVPGGGVGVRIEDLRGSVYGVVPNRVGVLFDIVDQHSVIKAKSYNQYKQNIRSALVGSDLVVPPRKNRYLTIRGKRIPSSSPANTISDIDSGELTAVGFRSVGNQYAFYDVPMVRGSRGLTGLKDFANNAIYRINNLASESLLGISFKPSGSMAVNIARLGTIPIAYGVGIQTARYLDYITEKFTGISPIKTLASAYAGARVAQQYARSFTGMRAGMDAMETYFPGSINSDGSTIARSVLAPILAANVFLKRGSFIGAGLAALGVYGAIGGPDPTETPEDLIREYTGDKKVPVRRGALWGLGTTPFFGGRVERYDFSWYTKLISGYRDKSLYGSESEYWSYHANVLGIPFPTPSNMFGLLNVLNPYRLEDKHYYDRPYAQTGSDLQNFPIIGPLIAGTFGQVLKPTRYRQPDTLPLLEASLAPSGLTPRAATDLGIPAMNATAYEAEDPNSLLNMIYRQANVASEPLGLYKFVMEFFGVNVRPGIGTEYATSAMMSDPGRILYDSGIGGALGQTELVRRFFLNDYSSQYRRAAAINPIANSMPRWLPGTYSESGRDRDYFMDFTMGDPFVKIADGEARLPGAGYESLTELHSGQPGVYSDVDRFLILADIAPYSNAYKQYEKRVLGMDLDENWARKVQEAIQQRQEVIGIDTRYTRYDDEMISLNQGIIAKGLYGPVRKAYDFLTHDVLAEIPYVGSKLFPFRDPLEQYRKTYVEGSEFSSWDRPWEDIIRPAIYDMALEDPLTAAGKGATIGALMSGPMRWFTPFKSIVGGAGAHMVNMATVKAGAVVGAGLSTARILSFQDQNMMPFHMRQQEDAVRYMDTLAYVRQKVLDEMGVHSPGNTMLGAKNPVQYRSALPTSADRRYFDYFAGVTNPDTREQIAQSLPSYMVEGLGMTWDSDFYTQGERDDIALDFVNNNQIPDTSWLGWNPMVSNSAMKLKLIEHGINGVSDNIHRFGFYESHEIDLQTRLREFDQQSIQFVQSPPSTTFDNFIETQASRFGGRARVANRGTALGRRRSVTVEQDRSNEYSDIVRRSFR